MIQIIGLILIMISTTMAGIYYGSIPSFRIKDLKEIKRGLLILKSEIEYAATPLTIACESISTKLDNPMGKIFGNFAQHLKEKTDDIPLAWQLSLEASKPQAYLTKEDINQLISFGTTLGYLDKHLQIRTIDMTTSYLNQEIEDLREVSLKNKKLYQTLGILGGLLIIIALY